MIREKNVIHYLLIRTKLLIIFSDRKIVWDKKTKSKKMPFILRYLRRRDFYLKYSLQDTGLTSNYIYNKNGEPSY